MGHYFDYNKTYINGYFDNSYQPRNSINIVFDMQTEYVPGYYYTTSGEKIEGFIRYDCLKNNVLFYKKNMSGLASTVNVKNCKGFVLLKDSFVVKQDAEIDWKSGIV